MSAQLQAYASRQAQTRPDSWAVVAGQERLSYAQLEAQSNQLARLLKDVGCRPGDRVGLLLPKSPAAIVCMLGVLKADCAYLPLDPQSPSPRTAMILRAAQPRALLAAARLSKLVDALYTADALRDVILGSSEQAFEGECFQTTFARPDWAAQPSTPLDSSRSGDAPAHLLFTSGSTGTPKGVIITHNNVSHFVEWARRYFGLKASDRLSGHPPLHFDLSTFDIYGTFSAGAELHLVPPALNLLPHKLADFIRTSELTQWFSVPSILTHMINLGAVKENDFPSLERLLWCGEAMPTPTLRQLMRRLPHVSFTNLYGPTEATIASSYYTLSDPPADDTAPTPIGQACGGEELLVLDDEQQPVGTGEVGGLYIAGVGLSPGYWRDEEKTRMAFLPHPQMSQARLYKTGDLGKQDEDGLLYCLGRLDSQVKSRGYRIELGEIEAALGALSLLKESAVIGLPVTGFEGTAICCAYTAAHDLATATLRKALSERLPSYMIPSRWLAFDTLPTNANGKIDRKKLETLFKDADG